MMIAANFWMVALAAFFIVGGLVGWLQSTMTAPASVRSGFVEMRQSSSNSGSGVWANIQAFRQKHCFMAS
jgi:hypothetical protein